MTDVSMKSQVPVPVITDSGIDIPNEQDILAGVQNDWKAAARAVGKVLTMPLASLEGQLSMSQSYLLAETYALCAQLVAMIDPLTSSGKFQDALLRIYRLTRRKATYGTVSAVVSGIVDQELPAGAQARSQMDGSIWVTQYGVRFDSSGRAAVTLEAQDAGSNPSCSAHGLVIYQQQPGWEGIDNEFPSAPGADEETRQECEIRRRESVQIGGVGQAAAVHAAVGNVDGVTDVYAYNNMDDDPVSIGSTNYTVPPHSIYIGLTGGNDEDIARAMLSKLDCGCGVADSAGQGTLVSVTIEDRDNYVNPYPSYTYRFVRAVPKNVYFKLTVMGDPTLPSTYLRDIRLAIVSAFRNGYSACGHSQKPYVPRARIGGQIIASNFILPVSAIDGVSPITIGVSFDITGDYTASILLGVDEQPIIDLTNIDIETVSSPDVIFTASVTEQA